MTSNEFLIRLMEIKQSANVNVPYFTDVDKEDILSWDEDTAEDIACYIVDSVIVAHIISFDKLFSRHTCPWCILNTHIKEITNCFPCKYGKRHSICTDNDSDYREFIDGIVDKDKACVHSFRQIDELLKEV